MPVSNACAIPSPVIGSTTAGRVADVEHGSVREARRGVRGGDRPGAHRLGGDRASGRGCRAAPAARAASGQSAFRSRPVRPSARSTPKPTFAPPSGIGNTHAYPGSRSSREHDPQARVVDVVEVLAHRVPRPEVARCVGMEQPAHRRPVTVGRDEMPRFERFVARDAPSRRRRRRSPRRPPRLAGCRRRARPASSTSAASRPSRATTPAWSPSSGSGSTTSPAARRDDDALVHRHVSGGGEAGAVRARAPRGAAAPGWSGRHRTSCRGEAGPVAQHDPEAPPRGRDRGRGARRARHPRRPGPSPSRCRRYPARSRARLRGPFRRRELRPCHNLGISGRTRLPAACPPHEQESHERRRLREADPRPGRPRRARRRPHAQPRRQADPRRVRQLRRRDGVAARRRGRRRRGHARLDGAEQRGVGSAHRARDGRGEGDPRVRPRARRFRRAVDRQGARQVRRARRRGRPRAHGDRVVRRLHGHGARAGRRAARLAVADVREARRDRRRQGQDPAPDRSRLRHRRGVAAGDRERDRRCGRAPLPVVQGDHGGEEQAGRPGDRGRSRPRRDRRSVGRARARRSRTSSRRPPVRPARSSKTTEPAPRRSSRSSSS